MGEGVTGSTEKLGLIAGNGRFPFLVLEAAQAQGIEVVVAAIKEETFPEIESHGVAVHWLSLGELSKMIEMFKGEGVHRAIMAGPERGAFAAQRQRDGPPPSPLSYCS